MQQEFTLFSDPFPLQFKKTIFLYNYFEVGSIILPVQFENHCSIYDGKAEQTDPSQENTPDNTWIKIMYHNLMRQDKKRE